MRFDEEHKVIIATMNSVEAGAYISFLYNEKSRHYDEIDSCNGRIEEIKRHIVSNGTDGALIKFWVSAVQRHRQDIEGIDPLIIEVKRRFGL
jgi:hypothetical protein